jgi:DNA polymerase-4
MSERPRAIVHLDLDAFFAAVEILENRELEGRPVVVGGRPEHRGVIASASYRARDFGVRSAMPTARALSLCPDAIVLPPRHRLYGDYSRQVMAILHDTSSLVEQVSVDEAFLDLSEHATPWDTVVQIAAELQSRVQEEVGLSASLGVATNKLVAKVASDQNKPGGLTVVWPGEEAAFLAPLPVRVLWGIGPVTAQRLASLQVTTVGELAQLSPAVLQAQFGRQGLEMANQARGQDARPVVTEREVKSISQERTFNRDLSAAEALEKQLREMSQRVARRLQRAELAAGTVAIKLRYADFSTLTRQMALDVPTDDGELIYQAALTLLRRTWQVGRPVRLLGVAARQLSPPAGQLPLW